MLFLVSKNRIVLLMLLVCGLCNIGCERKSNIKNDVVRLESRSIEIPTEYMMCIEGTSDSFFVKSDALKWIVYLDSANCSSCSLRSLYIWHNFLDKIEKYREDIGVFFIVHPSVTEDVGSLYLTAKIQKKTKKSNKITYFQIQFGLFSFCLSKNRETIS